MLNDSGQSDLIDKIPVVSTKSQISDELDEINFDIGLDDDEKKLDLQTKQDAIINADQLSNNRSIYVKNIDNLATPKDLEEHFKICGSIDRITILCDKYTGVPKGYAFVEFTTLEGKERSKQMNDSLFRGYRIKIDDKRKNVPMYYANHSQIMRNSLNSTRGMRGKPNINRNFKPY